MAAATNCALLRSPNGTLSRNFPGFQGSRDVKVAAARTTDPALKHLPPQLSPVSEFWLQASRPPRLPAPPRKGQRKNVERPPTD